VAVGGTPVGTVAVGRLPAIFGWPGTRVGWKSAPLAKVVTRSLSDFVRPAIASGVDSSRSWAFSLMVMWFSLLSFSVMLSISALKKSVPTLNRLSMKSKLDLVSMEISTP
jgi:hypothetical protein